MPELQHKWITEDFEKLDISDEIKQVLIKNKHPFHSLVENTQNYEHLQQTKTKLLELCKRIERDNVSCIFFLDKSARPASWLFSEFWKRMYPQKKIPDIRYLNYGREKSGLISDTNIRETQNLYKIPSNGTILVVDEFSNTGTSLDSAAYLLSKAFPDRTILIHDLQMTNFVSFPAKYKGVEDRTENSVISKRQENLSFSNSLRFQLKRVIVNTFKGRARLGLERSRQSIFGKMKKLIGPPA